MISIDRLKEMAIEELETELNNWKEQVELQSNFIDSLLKATNNSEWLDKTILDDEASEIIEKIELDYVQLDQLKEQLEAYKMEAEEGKEINAELKAENENWQKEYWKLEQGNDFLAETNSKLKQTLTEIKEIAEKIDDSDGCAYGDYDCDNCSSLEQETVCTYKVKKLILQKISEVIPDEQV